MFHILKKSTQAITNIKLPKNSTPLLSINQRSLTNKTTVNKQYSLNFKITQAASFSHQRRFKSSSKAELPYIDPELSYVYGRSVKELKYSTVAKCFDEALERETQTTACVVFDEGISKSYQQLYDDVNKLVNGLVNKLNLTRGDKVGVYSFNCYQWLLVQYACNKLGLHLFAINPAYKEEELAYILDKARLKVLFTTGNESNQKSLNDHWSILASSSVRKVDLTHLENIVVFDGTLDKKPSLGEHINYNRWHNIISQSDKLDEHVKQVVASVCSDDIYGIYQTSGTTGYPKGAVISQFTAINNTRLAFERLFNERNPEFDSIRPTICLPLPLFHEFAGVLGVLSPFCLSGGSYVLTGKKYSVESVVKAIKRFQCNVMFVTPTILIDFLSFVDKNNVKDLPLKIIIGAGSMVLPELVHKTHKALKDLEQFVIMYGSSEHGVLASVQSTNESRDLRTLTVGTPVDFTEIRIADPETNQIKKQGESGEIQTRGYNTMIDYFEDAQRTNEAIIKSRWFKTGDSGMIDKQTGSLKIVGRIKDLIIKGGENIYPAEVERIMHTHKWISDAQVFGIPDERYGEEVCVWIKLRDDYKQSVEFDERLALADILEFCKSKLSYYKVPKAKYVRFVDEYPLTAVKKIKKFEMRNQMIELIKMQQNK